MEATLTVGVLGAGIVQVASQAGYKVVACDRSLEALERAQLDVRDGLSRFAGREASSRKTRRKPPTSASTGR